MPPILFLVFDKLSIQLVDQQIYSRVHVLRLGIGKEVCAGDVYGRLRFLDKLFDDESHLSLGDMVKVSLQAIELV